MQESTPSQAEGERPDDDSSDDTEQSAQPPYTQPSQAEGDRQPADDETL